MKNNKSNNNSNNNNNKKYNECEIILSKFIWFLLGKDRSHLSPNMRLI